jgi:hypothetical protein
VQLVNGVVRLDLGTIVSTEARPGSPNINSKSINRAFGSVSGTNCCMIFNPFDVRCPIQSTKDLYYGQTFLSTQAVGGSITRSRGTIWIIFGFTEGHGTSGRQIHFRNPECDDSFTLYETIISKYLVELVI